MSRFYWIGNNLVLDFANTLAADENGRPAELLATFDDLLSWVVEGGLAPHTAAERVRNILNAEQQRKMVELAVDLRSEIKAMAKALAGSKPVPRSVISKVN